MNALANTHIPVFLSTGYRATFEQQEIIGKVLTGKSLTITAYAGAGKTSTLVECAKAMPKRKGLYLAFNRDAAEDAKKKFKDCNVEVMTVNGYAFRWSRKAFGDWIVPKNYIYKGFELAELYGLADERAEAYNWSFEKGSFIRAATKASIALSIIKTFCDSDDKEIGVKHIRPSRVNGRPIKLVRADILKHEMIDGLGDIFLTRENKALFVDTIKAQKRKFAESIGALSLARKLWQEIQADVKKHPLSQDVLVKLLHLSNSGFDCDYLMLDEAQDSSGSVVDIVNRSTCQKIIVGDSFQQIYGFRNAVDAMVKVDTELSATLSKSFRFGPELGVLASNFLAYAKGAKHVTIQGFEKFNTQVVRDGYADMRDFDAILCRFNKTVIQTALSLFSDGCKVKLRFREENSAVLKRLRSISEIIQYGFTRENFHQDYDSFSSEEQFLDHCSTEEGQEDNSYYQLLKTVSMTEIENLFNSSAKSRKDFITVTTAHKSKGLEWNRVKLTKDFPEDGLAGEEGNLLYVAMTRAKKQLDISDVEIIADLLDGNVSVDDDEYESPFLAQAPIDENNEPVVIRPDDVTSRQKPIAGMVRCPECSQHKCETPNVIRTFPRPRWCANYTAGAKPVWDQKKKGFVYGR